VDDRRYVVFEVASTFVGQRSYFEDLYAELNAGGYSALLHDLLKLELSNWHPRHDAPKSAGLLEQKLTSLVGIPKFWFDALWSGKLGSGWTTERNNGDIIISTAALQVHATTPDRQNHSPKAIRQSLKEMGLREDSPDSSIRGPLVPALPEARRRFEAYVGQPVVWPDSGDWTRQPDPPF
jgi:hypothetical protein